jgi:multimeric flavodoxin WrbA
MSSDATDTSLTSDTPTVFLLVASPRHGFGEALSRHVAAGVAQGGAATTWFFLASHHIAGCTECDACQRVPRECILNDSPGDGLAELEGFLDDCDLLAVVTPVFFAGPPSQLKAVYDRFQSRWARRYIHGETARAKRPASLILTGGGGDPYGFDPLVTISKSALAIVGFRIGQVEGFIGEAAARPILASLAAGTARNSRTDPLALPEMFVDRAVALGEDLARRAFEAREGGHV